MQVLLLMRNLSINLTSPDFEDHVSVNCAEMYLTSLVYMIDLIWVFRKHGRIEFVIFITPLMSHFALLLHCYRENCFHPMRPILIKPIRVTLILRSSLRINAGVLLSLA